MSEAANGDRWARTAAALAPALAFAGLYARTLNGDVQPADSGEFQVAAAMLGIPHPPGYPLFTLLGWLLAQIPLGSTYARISFLSVIAAAGALALVSLTAQALTAHALQHWGSSARLRRALAALAGLVASTALATSTTFWAQATTTNIRSLTALFAALMLYTATQGMLAGRAADLAGFALALGLGVGHHLSLAVIGVILGSAALLAAWRRDRAGLLRGLGRAALIFAGTQAIWLYLPVRDAAGARFAPGNLTTLEGLLFHILAQGFAGDMLAFAEPALLADRSSLLSTLLTFQFSAPLLALMGIAMLSLLVAQPGIAQVWLFAWGGHLFITLTYRAPQTVEYAMPCWVILSAMLGAGLGCAAALFGRWLRWTPARVFMSSLPLLAALAVAGRDGVQRWPSYAALAEGRATRAEAEGALRAAPANGVILAGWHQATPMWALQDIEGLRRDVTVYYVFPRGAQPYAETFAEQAAQFALDKPTLMTSLFAEALAARGVRARPLVGQPLWQVGDLPAAPSARHRFDGRLSVVGPLDGPAWVAEAGQAMTVDLAWYAPAQWREGDSLTVRLLRPDGRLAANADVRLSAGEPADVYHARRLILGLPMDMSPGTYDLLLGAYGVTDAGFVPYQTADEKTFVVAGQVTVQPASWPPATQHPLADPWGQTATPLLIGADYDAGLPGQLRVWTHWRLGNAAIQVALTDDEGNPLTPARLLPASQHPQRSEYLSLSFDLAPRRGIWVAPTGQRLPDYADGQRYVPFADQMALIDAQTERAGEALKVDLHWLAARPLTRDYVVSVRVAGGGLYQTHDSVPALGAIPTLKWIRDSRVVDRHPFALAGHRGPLRGSVVVYDSANQLALPPLDERYQGEVVFEIP
jgi:hypothetical protein